MPSNTVSHKQKSGGKLSTTRQRVRFGDVVKDVKESERNPLEVGLDRFVGLEHIEPENLHLREWGDLRSEEVSFTKRFRKGQVLFGKRRAYQRKVAVASFDGICSSDILTFEPKNSLSNRLLPFIVQSDAFFDFALDTSSGSLSPRTRWSQLKDFEFVLPSMEEQEKIADILWTADLVAENYRQAISDCELLANVTTTKTLKSASAQFKQRKLGSLICEERPLCYGIVQPGDLIEDGTPFVRVCDMESDEIKIAELARVTSEVHSQYQRSVIQEGDVIVSVVGTIGRCKKVPRECSGFNIARAVARLAPSQELDADFLVTVLTSRHFQRRLVGDSVETARKTLNLKALKELEIPVPNLETQRKLIGPIAAIQAKVRQLVDHRLKVLGLSKVLMNELISGGVMASEGGCA